MLLFFLGFTNGVCKFKKHSTCSTFPQKEAHFQNHTNNIFNIFNITAERSTFSNKNASYSCNVECCFFLGFTNGVCKFKEHSTYSTFPQKEAHFQNHTKNIFNILTETAIFAFFVSKGHYFCNFGVFFTKMTGALEPALYFCNAEKGPKKFGANLHQMFLGIFTLKLGQKLLFGLFFAKNSKALPYIYIYICICCGVIVWAKLGHFRG